MIKNNDICSVNEYHHWFQSKQLARWRLIPPCPPNPEYTNFWPWLGITDVDYSLEQEPKLNLRISPWSFLASMKFEPIPVMTAEPFTAGPEFKQLKLPENEKSELPNAA